MNRVVVMPFFIFIILMSVPAWISSAQEPGAGRGQGNYNLAVGEALDHAEENFKQFPDGGPDVDPDIVELAVEPFKIQAETKIIPLLHAEASSIIETLKGMKSPAGEVNYNEIDRTLILKDSPQQLEAMSAFVKKVDILLETEVFVPEFIKAADAVDGVKNILTENVGQVEVDEQANSLVATDTPLKIGAVGEFIAKLDRVNKEVLFEVRILGIVLNDEHRMGVDWEAIVSEYQRLEFAGFGFTANSAKNGRLNAGVVSSEDYKILLEALDTVGAVFTIAEESVTTENEATGAVSVYSSSLRDLQTAEFDPDRTEDLQFAQLPEEGFSRQEVRFHLTPAIKRDGQVTVAVKPQLMTQDTVLSGNPPEDNARIQVKDGDTIVIGSLFEDVMVESAWKIPLLGDLPLLGFVFRNQGEEPRKTEIITFLTVKTVAKENKIDKGQ